jgi:hypothetical protein
MHNVNKISFTLGIFSKNHCPTHHKQLTPVLTTGVNQNILTKTKLTTKKTNLILFFCLQI